MNVAVKIVQLSQLDMLGFDGINRKLLIACMMAILLYVICKPIMTKLIKANYIVFLTYLIVSMILTIIALNLSLINQEHSFIIITLQAIAFFGISLIVILLFKLIKGYIKQQFEKRTM